MTPILFTLAGRDDFRALVVAALTDEDQIAHGEAIRGGSANDPRSREGVGHCAYCSEPWPCRTQQGIDRLLAAMAEL